MTQTEGSTGTAPWNCHKTYAAEVTIRSPFRLLKFFRTMHGRDRVIRMFRNHCFSDWLDVPYLDQKPNLVHGMLLRQEEVNEEIHNQSHMLRFNVGDYYCNFGRKEFCLMTGLTFGAYNPKDFENAPTPLVQRIFLRCQNVVTLLDLKTLFDVSDF